MWTFLTPVSSSLLPHSGFFYNTSQHTSEWPLFSDSLENGRIILILSVHPNATQKNAKEKTNKR